MKEAGYINLGPTILFFKHILRKIFFEDWALKLSAVVITAALWFGVSYSNKKGTATLPAQLAFRVSDDAVLTSAGVKDVTIRVVGDDRKIDQMFGTESKATVDLTELLPGDRVLELTPDNVSISLPAGVKLEDIQPSRIAVRLEALAEKDLSVKVQTTGQPAAGYEIYNTMVTPAKVRVRGPESVIATLDFVPTGHIDINAAKSDVSSQQVPLTSPNPSVALFNTVVDVAVRIGERRVERTFSLATASGKRITAVLYGPGSLLTKTKPADLKVEILKSATGGDVPQLTLPDALQDSVEIRTLKIS